MSEVSVAELFIRLVFSMGVVIGVMALAARLLRKFSGRVGGGRKPGQPIPIEVLGRQALGRKSSIAIVRAGERGLLVGVTDHNVTLLLETTAAELTIPEPPRTAGSTSPLGEDDPAWKSITEQLRERTVRRS